MTELVNVTQAPNQAEVTSKLDFSTGSYTSTSTTPATSSSYSLPSIGGSVLASLPPVLEAGPWLERPSIPSWDDLGGDTDQDSDDGDDDGDWSVDNDGGGWSEEFQWRDDTKECSLILTLMICSIFGEITYLFVTLYDLLIECCKWAVKAQ